MILSMETVRDFYSMSRYFHRNCFISYAFFITPEINTHFINMSKN